MNVLPFLWQKIMMTNKNKWVIVGILLVLCGCYSPKRDSSVDPYNTPLIHLLGGDFDASSGVVIIQWEYLGEKPVANFVLQRRDVALFTNIERSSGDGISGQLSTVGSFQDEDLTAGERLQYRVVAEHIEGGAVRTDAIEISIPGAGLREIRRDPIGLAVQIVWDPGGEATGYELIRTPAAKSPEVVFTTDDPLQTTFWDRSINDNLVHAYTIRSQLPNGVQLTSRSANVQFYRESGRHLVETLRTSSERMRLSSADVDGTADLLAVIARDNQVSLSRLRHTVGVTNAGVPQISRRLIGVSFPPLTGIIPQSFDLAGPPLSGLRVVFPRAYIGGLDASGRVKVLGINLVQNTVAWQMPDDWISTSRSLRLAHDGQQRVYVVTGRELRVYSSLGFPAGAISLPGEVPQDFAVHDGVIWAAWPDRLSRGQMQFSGDVLSDIVWQDVATGLAPRALTVNGAGQVFVLDDNRLRIFKADGGALMSWVLPSGSFDTGDLAVGGSSANLVHLSNQNGEVITYVP